jgi:hypothetical protein
VLALAMGDPTTLETLARQLSSFSEANLRNQANHSRALDRVRQTQDLTVREVRSIAKRVGALEYDMGTVKSRLEELEGPEGPMPGVPRGSLPPLESLGEESPSGTWRIPKDNAAKYRKLREDAEAWRAVRKASWKIAIYVASAFALFLAVLGAYAIRDAAVRHPGVGISAEGK